jgi:predicted RNase H-like HicB family nuclease
MKKLQYLVRINKDSTSDWGASVPDLPGCVATGKSIDITLRRIERAIALHLRGMREDGEQGLENGLLMRDDRWSESIAVGSLAFIDQVKNELGFKADHRDVIESDGSYVLREPAEAYALKFAGGNEAPRSQNTFFWNEIVDEAMI